MGSYHPLFGRGRAGVIEALGSALRPRGNGEASQELIPVAPPDPEEAVLPPGPVDSSPRIPREPPLPLGVLAQLGPTFPTSQNLEKVSFTGRLEHLRAWVPPLGLRGLLALAFSMPLRYTLLL